MKVLRAGFAGLIWLLGAGSAHALSVDCNKITNPDENTICSEVSLAKLDHDLDNAYALMQAHLPLKMRDYVKSSQARWRVGPEGPSGGACKGNVDCIAKRYSARIAFLGNAGLPYEGVYDGSKGRFAVESTGSGALRVNFFPSAGAAQLAGINEAAGVKAVDNAIVLVPPAENCAARIVFSQDGAKLELKEAKKKACNSIKSLAGPYTRDYSLIPAAAAGK
ncbi:MAG TPA: hypothetical protein VH105_15335 [Burkholderiales bacterium]|jgi:uncharacterized protein|nr:hypothetical protein [Burkholderiales bacterium]